MNALSQEKTTQMVGFIKDKQPKGLWFVKERQHKLTKVRRVKGESSNMCINTLERLDPQIQNNQFKLYDKQQVCGK